MRIRGLFSRDQSIPENSLTAFDAAIRAGFGFELDVAMTAVSSSWCSRRFAFADVRCGRQNLGNVQR
jgi:hypothetical protein